MFCYILLIIISQTGSGVSPEGSLNILRASLKPPKLIFIANLKGQNDNGILEGYEGISLKVTVKTDVKNRESEMKNFSVILRYDHQIHFIFRDLYLRILS